jgi:cytochrome c peroxidase
MFGERPVELGLSGYERALPTRLAGVPRYRELFARAFPEDPAPISLLRVTQALASFLRTIVSYRSPYDRYVYGRDTAALDRSAQRGMELFFSERLECFHCHNGFNFSDATVHAGSLERPTTMHNTGLYNLDGHGAYPSEEQGLYELTHSPADMGRFRAPPLRNVALTAPYMHDGSMATLEEVIDHYAAGGRTITSGPHAGSGSASPLKARFVRGFLLSDEERSDLLAFLRSLTDHELTRDPRWSDPWSAGAEH